jgi:hypothetical protein
MGDMNNINIPRNHRLLEYQARAAMLTPVPLALVDCKQPARKPEPAVAAPIVDQTIEGSFPASDPPSWNPGIARPAPVRVPAPTTAAQ